jgi:hypothetical protein
LLCYVCICNFAPCLCVVPSSTIRCCLHLWLAFSVSTICNPVWSDTWRWPFRVETYCVISESIRNKEQFVALLTDCVVHKQFWKEKVKLFLQKAVESHGVVRRQGFHIFQRLVQRWRWGCQPCAPATLYSQEDPWCSFLLDTESTPEP